MLTSTFCHIAGIGAGTERKLWDAGILSWDSAIKNSPDAISQSRLDTVRKDLSKSHVALEKGDPHYFYDLLPPRQHWRLFPHFRDKVAYLDIETTGLSPQNSHITTIAVYDGKSVSTYVYGQNLDSFVDDIREYDMIVTYNGKSFDVPFIEHFFRTQMPQSHLDLRYILGSLGYRGGLKGCEKQLGFDRGDLEGVDGYFAVLLWYDYENNDNKNALETLLAYNVQDVVTLEALMVVAYNEKLKATPFLDRYCLQPPAAPTVPFHADTVTIERIRGQYGWGGPGSAAL
jgi:uncharacterized protein YprB with RNaseH-like and TPR domain